MNNLFLTDIAVLVMKSDEELVASQGAESAHAVMLQNCRFLKSYGAQVDDNDIPYRNVSGFPKKTGDPEALQTPTEFVGANSSVALLLWGSPHKHPSDDGPMVHGPSSHVGNGTWKTQAFESMAWLAPDGFVAMTFSSKYMVELYQPQHDDDAHNRVLLSTRLLFRQYVPMQSSPLRRVPITDTTNVMGAFLVPYRFMTCLDWRGDALDFGSTMLRVLTALRGTEKAVALGVYDCSLEKEIGLACAERDERELEVGLGA